MQILRYFFKCKHGQHKFYQILKIKLIQTKNNLISTNKVESYTENKQIKFHS